MDKSILLNFIATFAGVVLAFLFERFAFRSETIRKKREEKTKLKIALVSIKKSIEYNKDHLISLKEALIGNRIKVVLPLNTFAWDAYKEDVFDYLQDTTLRNDLVYFFLVAHTLKYLSDSYFVIFGQKLLSDDNNPKMKEYLKTLKENIEGYTNELLDLGDKLSIKLKKQIADL